MTNSRDTTVESPLTNPISNFPGDAAAQEFKRRLMKIWHYQAGPGLFASSIGAKMELIEMSVVPKREDSQVMEGRIVAEIDVMQGACFCSVRMLGLTGNVL